MGGVAVRWFERQCSSRLKLGEVPLTDQAAGPRVPAGPVRLLGGSVGDFDVDVIVIGSGFGGSVAALRLTEKGYRVLVLEKGKRWAPEQFAATNWNIPKSFWFPWLGCYGIWALHLLRDVLVLRGVGVGGGSLVYANTLLVPPEAVWDDPLWKGLEDWRRIMPAHYATAQRMLGATTNPRLGPADEALRCSAERRGTQGTFRPTQVGVFFGEAGVEVPDPYFGGSGPPRRGCTFCGACMTGCRDGAKNTLDKNYLYLAERGGAKVQPQVQAELLEPLPGGGWRVQWRRSTDRLFPERGAFAARLVVLAGGVLGTVPLLLDSQRAGKLSGLSPRLGEFTRTNSEALLGITSRSRTDLWKGVAITSEVQMDEHTHMEPVRFTKGADVVLLLGTLLTDGGGRVPRPLRWLANVATHPVDFLVATKPWGKAERSVVLLVMQTQDNHTRLVQRRRVFWPFRPTLTSQPVAGQARVPSYIPLANQVARELGEALDGIPQSTLNEVLLDVPTTAHILGGCPMGGSWEQGVVDSRGRVFGQEGLFVADGSIVGANLGVNPSLTITALAEHVCSHIPTRADREHADERGVWRRG